MHQAAGARNVLELHGTTHVVRCLDERCGHRLPRAEFQEMLAALNPEAARAAAAADAAAAAASSSSSAAASTSSSSSSSSSPAEPGGLYRRDASDDGDGAGRPRVAVGACGAVADDDPSVVAATSSSSSSSSTTSSSTTNSSNNSSSSASKDPLRAAHEGAEAAPIAVPFRRPDGDVEVADAGTSFRVPPCPACSEGTLMPHVVFFGDSLPKERAERAREIAASSDLLLVVGTSVQVFSAFRLVQACADNGGKIVIVNAGPTRADELKRNGRGRDGKEGDVPAVVMKLPCLAGETFARLARHPTLAMPRPVGAAASASTGRF